MRIEILGVPVDAVTRHEALEWVTDAISQPENGRPLFVVTPNPEFVVMASRDQVFMEALRSADLSIPDGRGLLWAVRRQGQILPERVTGTDLMQDVCAWAAHHGQSVFLLGGQPGVATQAAAKLVERYPGLVVAGADDGGQLLIHDGRWSIRPSSWDRLVTAEPDILFVAFGHGKQEKWIVQHLSKMGWLKMTMGIGGAFDFIAGRAKRAPFWMRRSGLEWLWRLVTEPSRWRRIVDAVIVFPVLVIKALTLPKPGKY